MDDILKYFPEKIQKEIVKEVSDKYSDLQEIRIRANKPIIIKLNKNEIIIKYKVTSEEILECMQKICENSIYSYQNKIAEGFITIKGGHRVGITGSCVIENGRVININYIGSLNFRIAKQILGCSSGILKYVINQKENTVYNTLIVSSPGAGKTTLLRDLIRQISNGIEKINFNPINVGVVDERGEIAALYKGIPQNDIGIKTDIMENVSKAIGMKMLIRSMSPNVIVADEIGSIDDIESINYAVCSGVKGIFTAHGFDFFDLNSNPIFEKLLRTCIFERIFFLDEKNKGKIKSIYIINKNTRKYEEI